jgi:hypothetical protein
MSTPSEMFTEMVTTTDRFWMRTVADNLTAHNALLRRMKDRGNIKTMSGGYEIAVPLAYGSNGTYQRFAGYDTLNTGASDVLTSAKYPVRNVMVTITASGSELRANNSKEAMFNLIAERKKAALRSALNSFAVDLYSAGTLDNQINGLQNIVQTNGQGTVGGINSTTWTFWRNKFKEASGTNTAATPTVANSLQFTGDINAMWTSLVRGADTPDLIVMTHDFYSLYEVGQQDKQRYTDSDMAKAGFVSCKYKGADVLYDENSNFATTGETAYFLNTDYLSLYQHTDASWTPDREKKPTNQDAVIIPIYWSGNLVCSNRALQGRLFDAS